MKIGKSLIAILVALLFSMAAVAQTETGQVSGTVTDPQGAVLPNTQVTITALGTGQTRTATTSASGSYSFANLQPGTYELNVTPQGFAPFKRRLDVTVGSRNTVDASLKVTGGQGETIDVVAQGGAEVNTVDQQLSQVVNSKQITELPTLTRNPYSLVATAGNVQEADPSGRGVGFAINGQRSASTSILLDGAENVDLFTATTGQSVPLDSVQEFRVTTSNFTAEYGRATGGIVNVATRSGTNGFHGSAYEFNRISALTSNTYDNNANGVAKPTFVRNQFGYSVGGPVVKNKLFFFNNTEWTRVRSSSTERALIPSPAFLATTAANTQAFFTKYGAVRPDIISRVPSAALPGFDLVQYSLPADSGGGAPQNTYSLVGRADWTASDKTTVYGRYALQSQDFFPGTNASSPYAGFDTGVTNFNNNFLISATHVFTPSFVSQSKFTFNRLNNKQPLGSSPVGPTLYIQATTASRVNGDRVALPGYLPFNPGSAIPFGGPQNLYQFYQDLSWNRGNHQFRFGGQFIHTRDNREFGAFENSVENLAANGQGLTTGLANLVSGNLFSFQGAVFPQGKFPCVVDPSTNTPIVTPECTLTLPVTQPRFSRNNRYNDGAAYLQDNWKVLPRVNLSLGVRWEYYGVQHNVDPNLDSNFFLGTGANLAQRLRNGRVLTAPNSPVKGLWAPDWNNFAPRVGFAWDIFGNGKTSFRGGYGISYERNFGNVTYNVIQNPPNYAVVALQAGVDVPTIPVTTDNAGPLAGTGTKPLPRTSLRYIDQNIRSSYAHMYSMALEQEILANTILGLEFSGSRGIHQYTLEDPNRPGSGIIYGGDPIQATPALNRRYRLNNQYTALNRRGGAGDSYYNGLNVSLKSNNFRNYGLTMSANYTWSHAIDTLSSTFSDSASNYNLGLLDPFNAKTDRGNADFDVRHRLTFSTVYEVPFAKSMNGIAKNILSGWTLAPIVSVRSGTPFTMFDCTFANTACARAVFDSPNSAHRGAVSDPAAIPGSPNAFSYFVIPANTPYVNPITGTSDFGNCTAPGQGITSGCPYPAGMEGRNSFRQPGVWNVDLGVYKAFKIGERMGLQLRAEAYNLFNHSNLYVDPGSIEVNSGDPTTNSVVAKRGTAGLFQGLGASADERRNLQLGVKFTF